MEEENLIVGEHVEKEYGKGNNFKTLALKDANFAIPKGYFTVILGPSGAGKTTLLNLIGGMDNVTRGSLNIGGEDVSTFSKMGLTKFRREKVGFVFQFYNLMPNLTAKENVELAVEVTKNHMDPVEALREVGLEDKLDSFPAHLSGGQQQRVSIARAIAKNPLLLLCDEPTGALDGNTGKEILRVLHDRAKINHTNVIVVTHNAEIKRIADQVMYIRSGAIEKIELNDHPLPVEELDL